MDIWQYERLPCLRLDPPKELDVNDDTAEISIDLSIHPSHDSHRSPKRRVTEQQREEARPLSEERTLPVPVRPAAATEL